MPLPKHCFDGLTQHFLEHEQLRTIYGHEAVHSSFTTVLHAVDSETFAQAGNGHFGVEASGSDH